MLEDLALENHIAAVGAIEGFPIAVIGDQNADVASFQLLQDALELLDHFWVDAGEGFVQQYQ